MLVESYRGCNSHCSCAAFFEDEPSAAHCSMPCSQEEPALIKAAKAGDAERVARLLANGHDPTARDSKGRSPYQLAANKEVRTGGTHSHACCVCGER